jgi:prepilin-type N-terminal cleavage/methylation domain-containing protein
MDAGTGKTARRSQPTNWLIYNKNKKMKNKKGFTLIELLVAIAIVGILASVVLVSLGNYRARARSTKLLGSLSSAVAGMQSCWSFASGNVLIPSSGSNICGLSSAQSSNAPQYGIWPDLSLIGNDYSYANDANNNNCATGNCVNLGFLPRNDPEKSYVYDSGFFAKKAQAMMALPSSTSGCFPKSGWYFAAQSVSDNVKVCCNSTMNGCKVIDRGTNCNSSIN